jgi:hypothetical protein
LIGYCERDPSEPEEGSWPEAVLQVCANAAGKLSPSKAAIKGLTCRAMSIKDVRNEYPDLAAAAAAVLKEKQLQRFCASHAGARCTEPESESDEGILMNARFVVRNDSAIVEAAPNAKLADAGNWSLSCGRDKMTKMTMCHANRGDLYIFFPQGGREYLSIGSNHFPGSQTSIRIGNQRFDTSSRGGNFAQAGAVSALKDGAMVVTRFTKWPDRTPVDDEFTLHGAQATVVLGRWMVKHAEIGN